MRHVPEERGQRFESVHRRSPEVDRTRILVVLPDGRDLADPEAKGRRLDQHLRVEYEVVAVLEKGNRFEKLPRVGAISGVVFREVKSEHAILGGSQKAIAQSLPPWHAG